MTPTLVPSDRAPGLFVAPGTAIPDDAEIAPHVTIYAGVELGPGVSLQQGAIVGRPQQIDARSRTPARAGDQVTVIGEGAHLGSGTIVVASARIGPRGHLGDHVLVREGSVVAEDGMLGRGVSVGPGNVIGARTRLQNDVIVGPANGDRGRRAREPAGHVPQRPDDGAASGGAWFTRHPHPAREQDRNRRNPVSTARDRGGGGGGSRRDGPRRRAATHRGGRNPRSPPPRRPRGRVAGWLE